MEKSTFRQLSKKLRHKLSILRRMFIGLQSAILEKKKRKKRRPQSVRLRVVSNFGDCDCGAGKIHTRARESSRRRDAKGAPKIN